MLWESRIKNTNFELGSQKTAWKEKQVLPSEMGEVSSREQHETEIRSWESMC